MVAARAATMDERLGNPWHETASGQGGSPLPNWAKRLRSILAAIQQDAPVATAVAEPLPFAGLFLPIVARAQRQLAMMSGRRYHELFGPQARDDLGRSLLGRLSAVASPALLREFDLFRHFARASTPFLASIDDDNGCALYDDFIAEMRGRLAELILEHPVLGRMIGTVVDSWLRATAELIRALADDGPTLSAIFAQQRDLGPVTAISCDLSDPHRGGRTVAILEFASGIKLVYKPKDLTLEQRWGQFLDWLRGAGAPLDLHSARVLARARHGWAEFIAAEAAGRSYRRAGALLALLYVLQARDIHSDNVAWRGDQPILLDLETLFHPSPVAALRDWPGDAATVAALERLSDSVAAMLYLPLWVAAPTGEPIALGGLTGVPPVQDETSAYLDVNTDRMRLAGAPKAGTEDPENRGDAAALSRPENCAALCAGFAEVYRYFQDNRQMIAADNGPIVGYFAGVTTRAVLKPTTDYVRKLRMAKRRVRCLKSGLDWSAQFGEFHQTGGSAPDAPCLAAVRAAERRSLANLDVPFFSAVTDSLAVEAHGEDIAACFTETPLAQVLARVKTLNTVDLDCQLALITASVGLGASAPCPVWRQCTDEPAPSAADFADRAIAACRDIALKLEQSAIRSGDGAAWLGIVPVDHDHEAIAVIGTDLYSGSIGVALFLAAFARIADHRPSRELALAAIASVMRIHGGVGTNPAALARMTIGGGFGIASVIYGLVQLATLLDRPDLLDHAIGLGHQISAERIAADRSHDLLRGAGGAILGLLALHRVRPEQDMLQRAIWCGEHVMTALPANGAAFALARLWEASGEPRFRDAALAAWRDAPQQGHISEPGCRGPVGKGIAAIGLLRSAIAADVQPALDRALATAAGASAFDDSLCCGRSGGIELLIEAGRTLGRPDLMTLARRTAAAHLLPISGGHDYQFRPGLFRGLSGVGYSLLRTLHPELLPCPLLWDGPPRFSLRETPAS
jgi:type 2 lantibiotic biosynthesis protein LanM